MTDVKILWTTVVIVFRKDNIDFDQMAEECAFNGKN